MESAGAHAVCAVGFRESPSTLLAKSAVELADAYVEHVYIHDDNLGPSVKFRIHEDASNRVLLKADPPPPRFGLRPCEPTLKYPAFYPTEIIAAVHEDLRMSPGILHRRGMEVATGMHLVIAKVLTARGAKPLPGFWLSSRFIKLAEYLRDDLTKVVKNNRDLGRVRLSLMENVPPMSLHLGVVRLSLAGAIPIVDLLFDTTDSDRDPLVFAHVVFANEAERIVAALATSQSLNLGKAVIAY